jgi:hypothetical protein
LRSVAPPDFSLTPAAMIVTPAPAKSLYSPSQHSP